jgi:hypothetical protein
LKAQSKQAFDLFAEHAVINASGVAGRLSGRHGRRSLLFVAALFACLALRGDLFRLAAVSAVRLRCGPRQQPLC